MGFLDSILGMFGIGQPKVALSVEGNSFKKGGLVRGVVTITGGRRPLPLTAIIVKVVQKEEKKTESGTSTDRTTLFELTMPKGGAPVEPGQTAQFGFLVQIPAATSATGGNLKHFISGSADVPGWDPEEEKAITVLPQDDEYAAENLKEYNLLPVEHPFRHSSVKGDYRLIGIDGGFLTTWKTQISVRNLDGSSRCRIAGWGKCIAVSADGKTLATANAYKQIAIFNLSNGEMIGEAVDMGDWVFDLCYLGDGQLLASTSSALHFLDAQGQKRSQLDTLDGASFYVGGLMAVDGGFLVSDSNGSRVIKADANGATLAKLTLRNPSDLLPNKDRSRLAIDCHGDIAVLDTRPGLVKSWNIPGQRGTRYLGQSEHSYNHFKAMPRLSPDGQKVLVQDGSGLLWLVGAESGEPVLRFERDVLDYVEDSLWLDANTIVAITNDGKVRKVQVDTGKVLFEDQDV